MSSALGKNQLAGTLKPAGKILVKILNLFEKNHCIINIQNDMYFFKTIKKTHS
jgi:hypothetical protein